MEIATPLCHIFDDLLESGLMEIMGLDRKVYGKTFERLRDYWMKVLPRHGQEYVMCSFSQLGAIVKTPNDWEYIGKRIS